MMLNFQSYDSYEYFFTNVISNLCFNEKFKRTNVCQIRIYEKIYFVPLSSNLRFQISYLDQNNLVYCITHWDRRQCILFKARKVHGIKFLLEFLQYYYNLFLFRISLLMAITIAVELHVQRYQKSVFLVIELLLAVSQLLHFLSNSFPLHYISSRSLFGMEDMITDEGIEYRASFVMWLIYSVFKNRKKNECDNKIFNERYTEWFSSWLW